MLVARPAVGAIHGGRALTPARARSRRPMALACGASVALVCGDVLVAVNHAHHGPHGFPAWLVLTVSAPAWTALGLLMATRVPDNPLGRAALWLALTFGLFNLTGAAATLLIGTGRSTAGTNVLAGLAAGLQIASVYGMMLFAQVVPTGRPLSRRWAIVLRLSIAGCALAAVGAVTSNAGVRNVVTAAHSPLSVPHAASTAVSTVGNVLVVLGVAAAIGNLLARWRRGGLLERHQIKWLLFAAAAAVVLAELLGPVSTVLWPHANWVQDVVWSLVPTALPAGTAVAIVRYRLYDIDRVISRTISYGAVTAVLVSVYIGCVAVTTRLLPLSSTVGVAASTLAAAGVFAPARRRVQSVVDRRFNRARYDATRAVEEFAVRLRDELSADSVRSELTGVVDRLLQPEAVSLWLVQPST